MNELSVGKLYLVKLLQDGKKEEDFIFSPFLYDSKQCRNTCITTVAKSYLDERGQRHWNREEKRTASISETTAEKKFSKER